MVAGTSIKKKKQKKNKQTKFKICLNTKSSIFSLCVPDNQFPHCDVQALEMGRILFCIFSQVVRGHYKGQQIGKVVQVYRKKYVIYIERVQREKANGTTVHVGIHPSKVWPGTAQWQWACSIAFLLELLAVGTVCTGGHGKDFHGRKAWLVHWLSNIVRDPVPFPICFCHPW